MELYLEDFDVAQLVLRTSPHHRTPLIEKNANTLEVDAAPELGPMHADLTRVRQVPLQPALERRQVHRAGHGHA